jgi:hypothetical protein
MQLQGLSARCEGCAPSLGKYYASTREEIEEFLLTPMMFNVLERLRDGKERQISSHYWQSALALCRRGFVITRSTGKQYFAKITDAGRLAIGNK